jgi:hypothetical protein
MSQHLGDDWFWFYFRRAYFLQRLERSLGFFSVFSVIQAPLRIGLTALKFLPGGKIRRNRDPHHYTSTSTLKTTTIT